MAMPAMAQDAYVIGVSGALTGPAAGTTAAPVEAFRIYFDKLNAAGGVNGKQVKLVILDDGAEPSKAAANAKRLLSQENVQLMVLSSFSSTFAPVSAEAKRANVPLLYMGSVCPKEVSPPAEANQFCTTAYILGYDTGRRSISSRSGPKNRCGSALPPWPCRYRERSSNMPRVIPRRLA